jgi:hypothetical protein
MGIPHPAGRRARRRARSRRRAQRTGCPAGGPPDRWPPGRCGSPCRRAPRTVRARRASTAAEKHAPGVVVVVDARSTSSCTRSALIAIAAAAGAGDGCGHHRPTPPGAATAPTASPERLTPAARCRTSTRPGSPRTPWPTSAAAFGGRGAQEGPAAIDAAAARLNDTRGVPGRLRVPLGARRLLRGQPHRCLRPRRGARRPVALGAGDAARARLTVRALPGDGAVIATPRGSRSGRSRRRSRRRAPRRPAPP